MRPRGPVDEWARCQVGRANPMLGSKQLCNTVDSAGNQSEIAAVDFDPTKKIQRLKKARVWKKQINTFNVGMYTK